MPNRAQLFVSIGFVGGVVIGLVVSAVFQIDEAGKLPTFVTSSYVKLAGLLAATLAVLLYVAWAEKPRRGIRL